MFLNIAVVFSTVLLSSSLVFADGPTSTSTAAARATHIVAAGVVSGFRIMAVLFYDPNTNHFC
jgi:hypothetical protein